MAGFSAVEWVLLELASCTTVLVVVNANCSWRTHTAETTSAVLIAPCLMLACMLGYLVANTYARTHARTGAWAPHPPPALTLPHTADLPLYTQCIYANTLFPDVLMLAWQSSVEVVLGSEGGCSNAVCVLRLALLQLLLLLLLLLCLPLCLLLLLQSAGRRVPFAFLEDIKGSFMSSYGDSWQQVSQPAQELISGLFQIGFCVQYYSRD